MIDRILIVGLGSIGRRHARIARALLPAARIIALRSGASASAPPAEIDTCVTRIEEALSFEPQAAVIASPSPLHLGTARACAAASIHLLIEKPISNVSDGVEDLIAYCATRQIVLLTGYNLRYAPSLVKFQELVREGAVGRVLYVRADVGQFLPTWRPDTDYRTGVSAQSALGGGVLLELSHEIDYLRWMLGDALWVSAVVTRTGTLDIDVEDAAHLAVGFRGAADTPSVVATLTMDCVRHDRTRTCTVVGESGTLCWDGIANTVTVVAAGSDSRRTIFAQAIAQDESYVHEWRDFLSCVETGARPRVTGRDGLAALEIVERARLSSERGAVVRIES
jgi:predicted dehydrogenase